MIIVHIQVCICRYPALRSYWGACALSYPARKVHSVSIPQCYDALLPLCHACKYSPASGPMQEDMLAALLFPVLPQNMHSIMGSNGSGRPLCLMEIGKSLLALAGSFRR